MLVQAGFADVEDVVMAMLGDLAATVTVPPAKFSPPLIQVTRVGGVDDGLTDRPLVYLACFGATYPAAKTLAEQCRQRILAAGCTAVALPGYPHGVLIDRTGTVAPPAELPADNPELRLKTATYRLELRRPRT